MERIHSLYLHVPFCTWVCKYCDFNAYAVLQGLIPPYVEVLTREIEIAGTELPTGPFDTVFIGGGTPSLLTGGQLRQVLDRVRAIGLPSGAEVTLEANPSNITEENVESWLAAGVSRFCRSTARKACSASSCIWKMAARSRVSASANSERLGRGMPLRSASCFRAS